MVNYFDFDVFMITQSSFIISISSFSIEWNSVIEIYSVSFNTSSQYNVSSASFCEILNLCMKSALFYAFCDSRIFAQIDVPLRINCFERINSFFSFTRYLLKFIILTAKLNDFSFIIFDFIIHNSPFTINYIILLHQISSIHPQEYLNQV